MRMKTVAVMDIAGEMAKVFQRYAVPSERHRKDSGDIQIDLVEFQEGARMVKAISFEFDVAGNKGVRIISRFDDISANAAKEMDKLRRELRDLIIKSSERRGLIDLRTSIHDITRIKP